MSDNEIGGVSGQVRVLPNPRNVRELLDLLRQRPGLMGSRLSVSNLESYLQGFVYCRETSGYHEDMDFLSEWSTWVRDRYESESTVGWSKFLEFHSFDDTSSLALFWKLYDEFLRTRQQ